MKKQQTFNFPILNRKSRLDLVIRPNLYQLLELEKVVENNLYLVEIESFH